MSRQKEIIQIQGKEFEILRRVGDVALIYEEDLELYAILEITNDEAGEWYGDVIMMMSKREMSNLIMLLNPFDVEDL